MTPLRMVTTMVKVTLNKDLVPYAGPLPTRHLVTPSQDLTHNYFLACKLIRAVTVLFHLRRGTAVFSGYIFDRPDATFKIRLYHQGKQIRCLTFSNLGYGGVMHVEIITQRIERAVHLDLPICLKERDFEEVPIGVAED